VVWVRKNLVVETPIHLLFISAPGETPTISQPRCLVVAESGSAVTLIEDYTNRRSRESAKEEERVYPPIRLRKSGLRKMPRLVTLELNGKVMRRFILGGVRSLKPVIVAIPAMPLLWRKAVAVHLEIFQKGEQTTLNGLTVIAGQQLADTHSAIALNHPYGMSRQLQVHCG